MAFLNADTNEYEKWFNNPFYQGYTAEQIISSCSSMKHWHETSVQTGNLLQLTARLLQLIFLFQTLQAGFNKDFVQILAGFMESQLKDKWAQSIHLKDLGKVTFASRKILFHTTWWQLLPSTEIWELSCTFSWHLRVTWWLTIKCWFMICRLLFIGGQNSP